MQDTMKRRRFIKSAVYGSGVVALSYFPYHLFAGDKKKFPYDKVPLGSTGIEVSRMAMGTGTHGVNRSSNQTRQLGIKGLAELIHAAYDEGIIFWDSADNYGSHPHLKEALKQIPRENVVILSKTLSSTTEEMKKDLDRFRKEIGTDYIDIMLLHCMMRSNWPEQNKGAMEVISRAKEDGIIKAHGVSCHSLDALKTATEHPWAEVQMARFNPAGVNMDAEVPVVTEALKKMKNNGKAIINMKVFGQGRLIDRKDECLQFSMSHDFIDCFTIGVESMDQLRDLQKRIPEASVRG